jgi:hypothetical protein
MEIEHVEDMKAQSDGVALALMRRVMGRLKTSKIVGCVAVWRDAAQRAHMQDMYTMFKENTSGLAQNVAMAVLRRFMLHMLHRGTTSLLRDWRHRAIGDVEFDLLFEKHARMQDKMTRRVHSAAGSILQQLLRRLLRGEQSVRLYLWRSNRVFDAKLHIAEHAITAVHDEKVAEEALDAVAEERRKVEAMPEGAVKEAAKQKLREDDREEEVKAQIVEHAITAVHDEKVAEEALEAVAGVTQESLDALRKPEEQHLTEAMSEGLSINGPSDMLDVVRQQERMAFLQLQAMQLPQQERYAAQQEIAQLQAVLQEKMADAGHSENRVAAAAEAEVINHVGKEIARGAGLRIWRQVLNDARRGELGMRVNAWRLRTMAIQAMSEQSALTLELEDMGEANARLQAEAC